jgi:hypothetical protein
MPGYDYRSQAMNKETIKALLNKSYRTGSWEIKHNRDGVCEVTITLIVTERDILEAGGIELARELAHGNGARRFDWK